MRRIRELDDVDARRKSIYLFPELQSNGKNETITASFSREFSRLKTKLKIPAEVTFHSFRHLFRSQLGVLNIPDRIIDALLGHQDVERKVKTAYEKFDSADLVKAVESFSLPMQNQRTKVIDGHLVRVATTKRNYLDFLHRDDPDDPDKVLDVKATTELRRMSNKRPRQRRTMAEEPY